MKKIMSFFLTVIMIAMPYCSFEISAEGVPAIVVETVVAHKGENVTVDIKLVNNPGVISMTLNVSYNAEVLTLTHVTDGRLLGAQSHKPEYKSPYTLAWVNDTATTNFIGNGVIAQLEFKVSESATTGIEYPITVFYNFSNYDIYNKDVERVNFAITNGSVSVNDENPSPIATPISDFSYCLLNGNICIMGYNGSNSKIMLNEDYEVDGLMRKVVMIEESAFAGNGQITSISLPATIESIGDYAFYNCTALTDVTLWSKYATIGERAFGYYSISGNQDGKIQGFTLTAYNGSTAAEYLANHYLSLAVQTKPVGKGDLDADGEYSASDLTIITKHLLMASSLTGYKLDAADLNNDGIVNIIDLIRLKKNLIVL